MTVTHKLFKILSRHDVANGRTNRRTDGRRPHHNTSDVSPSWCQINRTNKHTGVYIVTYLACQLSGQESSPAPSWRPPPERCPWVLVPADRSSSPAPGPVSSLVMRTKQNTMEWNRMERINCLRIKGNIL